MSSKNTPIVVVVAEITPGAADMCANIEALPGRCRDIDSVLGAASIGINVGCLRRRHRRNGERTESG